jgi:predicted Rossmann-fold nucleotide-binding protein
LRGLTAEGKASEIERLKKYIALRKAELGFEKIGFVCGSAFNEDPAVLEAAKAKGKSYGITVTGAGSKSVMGAIADGATLPIGVTCDAIMTIEPGFRAKYLKAEKDHIMVYTDNPVERLDLMIQLSDVVDCERGGIGTTEEALKGAILGKEVLLQSPFFDELQCFFDRMLSYGFITAEKRSLIKSVNENNAATPHNPQLISVDSSSFAADSQKIVVILKTELADKYRNTIVLPSEQTPIDRLIPNHDCFVAIPSELDATSQLFELIVQKRISNTAALTGGEEILKNKPIVLINMDGYYDNLLEMLQKFEKEGYLKPGEKTGDLIKVIDIKSKATDEEIRQALKDKLSSNLPALAQAATRAQGEGPAG